MQMLSTPIARCRFLSYNSPMFTDDEKKLLGKYVTSTEANVFAVRNMPGMVGAAYARYSRAKGGFREVLLKEFIKEGAVDPAHADQLIERVLIAFGDDSVGELEGAHVSFEDISMLATKEIEDRRIGGSPIEQSTRYVFYDQKLENGSWRYLQHPSMTAASFGRQYRETMDFIFQTYADLVEPMKAYFTGLKPMDAAEYDINGDGVKEKFSDCKDEREQKAFKTTYGFDLRSKACDALRCLLPLATLTNVGMFGNGRFYQHTISHLLTSDIPEAQEIGQKALAATSQVIRQYVRRARRNEYIVKNRTAMRQLAAELFSDAQDAPQALPQVDLQDEKIDRDVATIAAMLFPYSRLSLRTLRAKVAAMPEDVRQRVIAAYIGDRQARRDRPGRALEDGYPYTFDLVTNWGVYKDLMRHRMNTQQRQLFTTKLGFDAPQELIDAGFMDKAQACVDKADALFDLIVTVNPELAQYAVLHGHGARWSLGANDRELLHLTELRSTPQGHPQYRKVAQLLHRAIAARSAWRGSAMKFVDYGDYFWSRADSEAKQRVKEMQLEDKGSV